MSYIRHSKPRRKLQHVPTNIDELSKLLNDPSANSIKKRHDKEHNKPRSKSAGGSEGRFKSIKVRQKKSKSVPALSTSSHSRVASQEKLGNKSNTSKVNSLDPITFKIGNVTYEMDSSGEWTTSMNKATLKEEVIELRKSNRRTSEENNLLRVKNELLLDMIAKKNLRIKRFENDLVRLRKILSTSSLRFSSETGTKKK